MCERCVQVDDREDIARYFGCPRDAGSQADGANTVDGLTSQSFEHAYQRLVEVERSTIVQGEDVIAESSPEPPALHNVSIPSAFGRTLTVPQAIGGIARFHFDELCGYGCSILALSIVAIKTNIASLLLLKVAELHRCR